MRYKTERICPEHTMIKKTGRMGIRLKFYKKGTLYDRARLRPPSRPILLRRNSIQVSRLWKTTSSTATNQKSQKLSIQLFFPDEIFSQSLSTLTGNLISSVLLISDILLSFQTCLPLLGPIAASLALCTLHIAPWCHTSPKTWLDARVDHQGKDAKQCKSENTCLAAKLPDLVQGLVACWHCPCQAVESTNGPPGFRR